MIKRWFLGLLILLLVGAGLGQLMAQDAGYVVINYNGYSYEATLWSTLLALIVVFAVVYVLLRLRRLHLPRPSLGGWRERRRQRKAVTRTIKGLNAFAEGAWDKAEKQLSHAANDSEHPIYNLLAAAQAACEQGHRKEAFAQLSRIEQALPCGRIISGLMRARLHYQQEEYAKALEILTPVYQQAPRNTYVLRLIKDLYLQLERWEELSKLLPELKHYNAVNETNHKRLETLCAHHLLDLSQAQFDDDAEVSSRMNALVRTWQNLRPGCQHDPEVILHYIRLMQRSGDENEAERQLRKLIEINWDDRLVEQYGRIKCSKPNKPLTHAKRWRENHGDSAALELTLGRLSMLNQQWGVAVTHFERSIALHPTASAYAELSRLQRHLGKEKAAEEALLKAFHLSNGTLPTLPLPTSTQAPTVKP